MKDLYRTIILCCPCVSLRPGTQCTKTGKKKNQENTENIEKRPFYFSVKHFQKSLRVACTLKHYNQATFEFQWEANGGKKCWTHLF